MKAIIETGTLHLQQRFRLRALEWEHACISVVFGLSILIDPGIFDGASFRGFVGGPQLWGWGVLLMGLANIIALIINGTVPKPTA
ncbi:hypothetical protein, partial [Klebsiella pneumoniae]|uniref:hypothetical protein n=1 Tax=Klebsiella pneumoniae TaxID=573 RepID=UPI0022B9F4B2